MNKPSKDYTTPALDRTFQILDVIKLSGYGRTVSDLSRTLNLPYSTTFYLLKTMERIGLVKRNGDNKRFFLGPKLFSYQGAMPQSVDLQVRDIAAVYMERIVNDLGFTTHIGVPEGNEAVYIDRKESPSFVKINSWIGQHVPLYCTAVGKSLLLLSDLESLKNIFPEPLPRLTEQTIVSITELLQHLQRFRELGYTVDEREAEREGVCVASPILSSSGAVVAAIGVSTTTYQLPSVKIPEVGKYMHKVGQEISGMMGFHGQYPGC